MEKNKLYICSCGMRPGQLTPETIKALKLSQVVFSHSLEGGPAEALIRGFCPDFRPLVGREPAEIVRAVKSAFKTRRTAAFLTYGNPFFLNAAAVLLKRELEKSGVEVEPLPAVSSFDSIVNMLGLELPAAGLRLLHAGLSGGELTFYPDMAVLVFMADKLNRFEKREHSGVKEKFIRRIAAAYPPGHRVFIVNAPFMEDREGRVVRTTVKNLARDLGKADRNSTLYIPAAKTRP
ncbi:MAG: SAM-dependent methyltransferase [Elusimicrobiota bacterium]|nr:SAM-dependent methyltransferase [Elusimicrobiota bacterium]